jgi:hypothetical protein
MMHTSKNMQIIKIWDLTCSECAMTEPMQPCEACPNRGAQGL